MPKPLTVLITTNCGKFFKRREYQTTWPVPLRNLYTGQAATVRTGHGITDWFRIWKGVCQGYIRDGNGKIPWMEEPGRLQSMGSLGVGHDWVTYFHFSLSCIGEGNGNLLQCSCLENPGDRGASWAAVYGVAQSRTWLKQLSSSSSKAVYCHPAYLTYMQSTSWEMPGWMKHKLESRLPGEISITSDRQMTPPLWQKVKRN